MKKVCKDKKGRSTGEQPGTKSASRPNDELRMYRLPTAYTLRVNRLFCSRIRRRPSDVCSMPGKVRGTLVSWRNSSVSIQSCPAPLRRLAVRSEPSRPWYDRVLDSTRSVYIAFRLFVFSKSCSRQLNLMPWRKRVTVVSCAEKPVGVPSCRARHAQLPRCAPPDPTRPWCVRVWIRQVN